MRVRDGPAAVRGDALRHDATGPAEAGKAAEEGAPSQKTCRPPRDIEPLAEGGFVLQAPLLAASRRRTRRRLSLGGRSPARPPPRPAADRLALADRDRGRCSRSAPASRSSPSTSSPTTRSRRRARASPASPRTSRRSPATSPDLVVISYDPSGLRRARCASSGSAWSCRRRPRTTWTEAYAEIRAARAAHRPRARRRRPLVALDEEADRRARRERAEAAPAA